ncbi:MAG: flagellar motor switch protein FliN [Microthrixaceae bacterium]
MNQLETRTEASGDDATGEAPSTPAATTGPTTTESLLSEALTLAAAIGEALNGDLTDGQLEIGPADVQIDTKDMTPESGVHGVITSLKGGLVSRVVMMVDDEVQRMLESAHIQKIASESDSDTDGESVASPDTTEARSAWLATVAEPMERWARLNKTTLDSALPIENARQIDHLLLGQGLVIVAVGLFLDGRHVGSLALAGFERSQPSSSPASTSAPSDASSVEATPVGAFEAEFEELDALPRTTERPLGAALQRLADVEMLVTAELGRTRMNVSELLTLGPGSIIELDRAAGSPVDLLVNNTLIARGEVVVVDEEYGVRLTEIVGPVES